MSKDRKRSIKSAQIMMRELNFKIDGTSGTPSALGLDKLQIASVVDNGVGDYTINLLRPFNNEIIEVPQAQITSITAQRVATISAISASSITIEVTDLAGAAADADLDICMKGSDARYVV